MKTAFILISVEVLIFYYSKKKRKSEINVNTPVTSLRSMCVCVRWDEEGWKGERDTKREPGPLKFWEKKWVKVMPFSAVDENCAFVRQILTEVLVKVVCLRVVITLLSCLLSKHQIRKKLGQKWQIRTLACRYKIVI